MEGISDKDRPLKGRGVRDAHLVSDFLADQIREGEAVQLYSSPATRALHTALIFAKNFGIPASKMKLVDELYHCHTDDLHLCIKRTEDWADTAFYFAHNPTITTYVNKMTKVRIDNVPTTGVVCLRFDVAHWAEIGPHAELIEYTYPKRLRNDE